MVNTIRQFRKFAGTMLLLLGGGLVYAQPASVSITLDLDNVPVEQAMRAIESQSRYLFINKGIDTGMTVSADVDAAPVQEALSQMFDGTDVAYSFDGITNNIDFVPYDIPVPGNYATRQRLQMDASTSRVYLKGIANTRALGRVVIFIDADFRGGRENSYTPRLRSAYVSFKGLTLGRDVSTFCDLTAAPETVDFQGPNAYNYNFATMIRYEYSFCRDHFTLGMAAEMPNVSATYGTDQLAAIPQRVPDFPVYFQYAWGKNRQNHFRASAVFRDMYYYNLTSEKVSTHFGWGVQASGNMAVGKALNIYFNGVYGEGITPYIQDLTGSGLDFTPNPLNPTYSQVTPMYGWQAAARINLLKNLFISGGYSMVKVLKKNTFYSTDEYREGQYIFGNIFYHITPRFKIAAEYLYGTRRNMDGARNHANRVNLMAQYNF